LMLLTLCVALVCNWGSQKAAELRAVEAELRRIGGFAVIATSPDDWFHRCGLGELSDRPVFVSFSQFRRAAIIRAPLDMYGTDPSEPLTDIEVFFLCSQRDAVQGPFCDASDDSLAALASFRDSIVVLDLNNDRMTDGGL